VTYPHVRVSGSARERGVQYGAAARDRITRSVSAYATVFEARLGWSWSDVTREAAFYRNGIGDLGGGYLAEIDGIAEGAGLSPEDILALNVRTEIMALGWTGGPVTGRRSDGCTGIALLPARTASGSALFAQTWDWLVHTVGTLVVLEVERDDGPSYVTVVEAGLIAKIGLNSSGLAVGTNFLLTRADGRTDGVPYHLTLRSLLDAESLPDAFRRLQGMPRASSANYLLVHADGVAVDVESAPGGPDELHLNHPVDGVLAHANHYRAAGVQADLSMVTTPDSPFRQDRVEQLVAESDARLDVGRVQSILADHASFPRSICAHGDLRRPEVERETTACALIVQPASRQMWLSDGNPCAATWRELETAPMLLSRPSRPALDDAAPAMIA